MKKLSILLALIMALSCFTFVASALVTPDMTPAEQATYEEVSKKAEEEASKAKVQESIAASEAADRAKAEREASSAKEELSKKIAAEEEAKKALIPINIKVIYSVAHADGTYHDSSATTAANSWPRDSHDNYVKSRMVHTALPNGTTVTASTIFDLVKTAAKNDEQNKDGSIKDANPNVTKGGSTPTLVIDGQEYVLNEYVFEGLPVSPYGNGFYADVVTDFGNHPEWATALGSVTVKEEGAPYGFICYAAEIDDVANFAQVAASQLGGYQWNGVAKANVALVNELIKGFGAAADVVAKELPEAVASNKAAAENGKAVNGTTATSTSPKTGTSAVAGVAIVVLALATTTTVVLRKKED